MATKKRITKGARGTQSALPKRSKSAISSARTRKPDVNLVVKRVPARMGSDDAVKVARVTLSDGRTIYVPESGGKLQPDDIDRAVDRAIAERLSASGA
jgi:hypothetical protein